MEVISFTLWTIAFYTSFSRVAISVLIMELSNFLAKKKWNLKEEGYFSVH